MPEPMGVDKYALNEKIRVKLTKFWSIPGTKIVLILIIPFLLMIVVPFITLIGLIKLARNAGAARENIHTTQWVENLFLIVLAISFLILLLVSGANLVSLITDASLCMRPSRHTVAGCFRLIESPSATVFFAVVYYFMFWISLYVVPASLCFACKLVDSKV